MAASINSVVKVWARGFAKSIDPTKNKRFQNKTNWIYFETSQARSRASPEKYSQPARSKFEAFFRPARAESGREHFQIWTGLFIFVNRPVQIQSGNSCEKVDSYNPVFFKTKIHGIYRLPFWIFFGDTSKIELIGRCHINPGQRIVINCAYISILVR